MKEGRKLSKALCVEKPLVNEIANICSFLNLNHVVEEGKCYSRDIFSRGRIRVQIFDDTNQPVNKQITSRKSLLKFCGMKIRSLKSRVEKNQSASSDSKSDNSAGIKKKGKKGKKKITHFTTALALALVLLLLLL